MLRSPLANGKDDSWGFCSRLANQVGCFSQKSSDVANGYCKLTTVFVSSSSTTELGKGLGQSSKLNVIYDGWPSTARVQGVGKKRSAT